MVGTFAPLASAAEGATKPPRGKEGRKKADNSPSVPNSVHKLTESPSKRRVRKKVDSTHSVGIPGFTKRATLHTGKETGNRGCNNTCASTNMDIASLSAMLKALCMTRDDTVGNNILNHTATLPKVLPSPYQNIGMNGGAHVTWFLDYNRSVTLLIRIIHRIPYMVQAMLLT